VKIYGTSMAKDLDKVYPLLVMEYCERTLDEIIYEPSQYQAPGNLQFSDALYKGALRQAASYAHQISCGLMAIHQLGFLHRDLKPENILIDNSGTVKI